MLISSTLTMYYTVIGTIIKSVLHLASIIEGMDTFSTVQRCIKGSSSKHQ